MLGVFITFMGGTGVSRWSSDQMDEDKKYVSMLIPFFLLDRRETLKKQIQRWKGQVEGLRLYSSYQDAVGCLWRSTWVRVGKFPNIFIIVHSSRNPTRLGETEDPDRGGHRPDHLSSCQCPMTWSGARVMWVVFRKPKKSRIMQWDSRKDIGHSWTQGRKKKSGMEVLFTPIKGNEIVQPPKWINDEKKLIILYSKVSVPWVVESWHKRKVKSSIHFNGDALNTELLFQTLHFVNQLRVYGAVSNLLLSNRFDRRREGTNQHSHRQQDFDHVEYQKKYNSWYLLRHKQLKAGFKKESWVSTSWPAIFSPHNHAK